MKSRLIVEDSIQTLKELQSQIEAGGKFVVFQYCISLLFAVTLRRLSPAFFVKDEADIERFKKKYNLISYLFGWWGIPWGPVYTVRSLRGNNNGGTDVTEDILLNLTEENFRKREIKVQVVSGVFEKPSKWDAKAFDKTLKKDFDSDPNVEALYAGLYLNVPDDEEPYYVVGIDCRSDFDTTAELVNKSLRKQFKKHVYFEFIDLNGENGLNDLLRKQGEKVV